MHININNNTRNNNNNQSLSEANESRSHSHSHTDSITTLLPENSTAIHIDVGGTPPPEQLQRTGDNNSTSIDMEGYNDSLNGGGGRSRHPNFISFFNARSNRVATADASGGGSGRLRATAPSDAYDPQQASSSGDDRIYSTPSTSANANARPVRSWRMNLNGMFSFAGTPTEALRSLITQSSTFRYAPLAAENATNADDNLHLLLNQNAPERAVNDAHNSFVVNARSTGRSNSLRDDAHALPVATNGNGGVLLSASAPSSPLSGLSPNINATATGAFGRPNDAAPVPPNRNASQQADGDDDNSVISDLLVKLLGHFVRYLPFICILLLKFVHDHVLGILDLVLLHCIMYHTNKSLREQIAKFSQKSYSVLLRDASLVAFVVAYRFVLSDTQPDALGLLVPPPVESITLELTSNSNLEVTSGSLQPANTLNNYLNQLKMQPQATPNPLHTDTVTITKAYRISLGVLLYYVAVNDLVLKLITILVKTSITILPTKVIRHKQQARMFALMEYLSQFYRALAPMRQWLLFLFKSYSGLEVISGILFSSFYIGAKGFECVERGKSLKKAFLNFVRNMDYERKPTKDELDAAGSQCPICHDAYNTPVVLECSHIFCDDCVSTWFKREQTCPMCRAKVSEDPAWQDGATTFFYQLC